MADEGEPLGVIELDQNLGDAEKPAELPAGSYIGEVQDVQIQDSAKGNRYFAIKFVIPPDEIPADLQDQFEDGAILYWNRQIVPTGKDRRALFNLRKLVESLGLDANTSAIDPNEWMGQKAKLRVKLNRYQGELRAEIGAIEPEEAQAAPARGRGTKPVPEPEEEDEAPAPRRGTKPAGRAARR